MIVAIEGEIKKISSNSIYLKIKSGITYEIFLSLNSINSMQLGDIIELKITQIIREDSNLLYGFINDEEKNLFDLLLKVNGIGSSVAIKICSNITPMNFIKAVFDNSVSTLVKLPGIGQKMAKKIIAELSDNKNLNSLEISNNDIDDKELALKALINLGFKESEIIPLLKSVKSTNTSDIVKEILKNIK